MLSGFPPLDGRAHSFKRLSRDDSQPDLGFDAGQPVFAVLQCKCIAIAAPDTCLAGQIFQRCHAIEPAQSIRCHQSCLVSGRDYDDLGGQQLVGSQPSKEMLFAIIKCAA